MDYQGHSQEHRIDPNTRRFAVGVSLNVIFIFFEVWHGLQSGSLGLLADAGHNASDVLGLLLAWGAYALAQRPRKGRYSYGLHRATIQTSFVNALFLLVAVGVILRESLDRLHTPVNLNASTVIWVGALGLIINIGTAMLFRKSRHDDLNLQGAYLHLMLDGAVTAGVMMGGVFTLFTGKLWIDPILGSAVAVLTGASAWGLLRESTTLSLDDVPNNVDLDAVHTYLAALKRVLDVHDLHLWPVNTTETALTVHLVVEDESPDTFVANLAADSAARFEIRHCTIQLERERCQQAFEQPPGEVESKDV